VGDAAGRPATTSSPKDWNDTDRKLALNIGVSFLLVTVLYATIIPSALMMIPVLSMFPHRGVHSTPEEWFSGEPTRTDFVLSGFDPLKYDHDRM
jgi:hypothetical protein